MSIFPVDIWWTIGTFLHDSTFITLFHTSKFVSQSINFRLRYNHLGKQWKLAIHQDQMIRNVFRETADLYRWALQMKYVTYETHEDIENMIKWESDIEVIKLMIPIRDHIYKDDSHACHESIKQQRFDLFCLVFDERLKIGFEHTINTEELVHKAFKLIDDDCGKYNYETLLRLLKCGKASLIAQQPDDINRYINCKHGSDNPDYDDMTESEQADYWKNL